MSERDSPERVAAEIQRTRGFIRAFQQDLRDSNLDNKTQQFLNRHVNRCIQYTSPEDMTWKIQHIIGRLREQYKISTQPASLVAISH